MDMRKLFITALLASLAATMFAQANASVRPVEPSPKAYAFTLEDCITFAFANSYDRKSMELSGESQQISYKQSKESRAPSVNASIGENLGINNSSVGETNFADNFSGNVGVSASVPIYQGGQIKKTIEQNRLNMERTNVQLEQYDNQLSVQILQAFLSAISNEELLKHQEDLLKTTYAQMQQGQVRYNVGSILESDKLLLEAQYYSDSSNVVQTRINRDNSILSLKILLSMNPADELTIISPNTDNIDELNSSLPSEQEAVEMAMEAYPNLRLSQYDVLLAENSVKLAKSNLYPSINASAGVSTGHRGFADFGNQLWESSGESVGVSMSIPIYNRGATRANVKKNEISLQQAQLSYEQTQLDIRQTVSLAYRNVVAAFNSYKASEIKEEAYNKSYHAYETQFEHGTITAVDLLQQQNNYLNALNQFIQDKYSLVLQRKVLDVYMGKPITL